MAERHAGNGLVSFPDGERNFPFRLALYDPH